MRLRRAWAWLAAAACALLLVAALAPGTVAADPAQESVFQDDAYLIYQPPATVNRTLATLQSLGVQQVRVTLKWSSVAPSPQSRRRPSGFNALDPGAYPAGAWSPYDRVVQLAARHHISVEFNVTAPGPLWAMGSDPPSTRAADHWEPSAREFFSFVYAAGVRYSGHYGRVSRVSSWSIWNEPNQPGWLAPQWRTSDGQWVLDSARLYREYVGAATAALAFTGHVIGHDSVLIGELAPEGYAAAGPYVAVTPMPFLRALYCLDGAYRPLRGSAAAGLGCPTSGPPQAFVSANPALFYATGFAHHPYYFLRAPWVGTSDPNFAPLANLGRLERGLDRALATYGVHRRLPIYLTEYGYQTNPPDPYQLVSPRQQASYLNAADYMAWRDSRVRSVAQFLLYDAGPDARYRSFDFRYWDTFQTGLRFADGRAKPAFAAYRMPIWLPVTRIRRGHRVLVWGQVRPATQRGRQRALVQWHGRRGGYETVARVLTNRSGYLTVRMRPASSGEVRIAWQRSRGAAWFSRSVYVSVR